MSDEVDWKSFALELLTLLDLVELEAVEESAVETHRVCLDRFDIMRKYGTVERVSLVTGMKQ